MARALLLFPGTMKPTERKYGILFSDSAWRNFSALPSEEMGRVGRALEWMARRALTGAPDDDRALRVCGIEGKYSRDRRHKLLRVNALHVRHAAEEIDNVR